MYLNHVLELFLVLDAEKFGKVFDRVYNQTECVDDNRYVDQTLADKGILVTFHDKQYKKKVQLTVNPNVMLEGDTPDKDNASKLVRKLEKCVGDYLGHKHELDDFSLNGLVLMTDIDVGNRAKVSDYVKVLRRIGQIKGFSPPSENWIDDNISLCLEGNSNGISFLLYDLEGLLRERLKESDSKRKQLKTIAKKSDGIIRAEVRLTELKAIRVYSDETATSEQIVALSSKSEDIFLDTFQRVVPFGDFYKKDKAMEIIRVKVTDVRLRRRMLRLLELVPEKKSLLLAQKALNYRRVDEVMEAFGSIEVSPLTISKRHSIKRLSNLYKFM